MIRIRLIHCGDIHYGIKTHSKNDPITSLPEITLLSENYLSDIVSYAISNEADFFLITGDIFDRPNPSTTLMKRFILKLKPLLEKRIHIIFLAGNHDLPNHESRACPLDLFALFSDLFSDEETNLIHATTVKPETLDLTTKKSETARFYMLPYIHPMKAYKVFESRYSDEKKEGKTIEEIWMKIVSDQIQDFVIEEKKSEKSNATILCAHLTTSNAVMNQPEILASPYQEAIPVTILENDVFDYVALSHIHKQQEICKKPPIVYSGSLYPISFKEEGEEKGFIDVTLENGKTNWTFQKIPVRKYSTIKIDLIGKEDPTHEIIKQINLIKQNNPNRIDGAIVRLKLKISRKSQRYIKFDTILKEMQNASYYCSPVFDYQGDEEEDEIIDISYEEFNPLNALKEILVKRELPEKEIKEILKLGDEIIKNVEER